MGRHSKIVRRDDVASLVLVDTHQLMTRHKTGDPQSQEILMTIPVDFRYWVSIPSKAEDIDIYGAFELLLNHVRLNPIKDPSPQQLAELGLIHLKLQNWQRAIAWCFQIHTVRSLNMPPFNTREYKAFRKFGEMVYAKFYFLLKIFYAFEGIDHPPPFLGHSFARIFVMSVLEDINLGLTHFHISKESMVLGIREDVAKLKARQNIYDPETAPINHHILQVAFQLMPANPKDNNDLKSGRFAVRKAYTAMVKAIEQYNTQIRTDPSRHGLTVAYIDKGEVFRPEKRSKGKPASRKITNISDSLKKTKPQ